MIDIDALRARKRTLERLLRERGLSIREARLAVSVMTDWMEQEVLLREAITPAPSFVKRHIRYLF